jgi:hypothetical protein
MFHRHHREPALLRAGVEGVSYLGEWRGKRPRPTTAQNHDGSSPKIHVTRDMLVVAALRRSDVSARELTVVNNRVKL